ncbi:noncanonical pyrimidine nucleotidase, YjjG family [Macrococcoides goetzii]|nr:YjjG family noncanonical pyrimidine nucleotidase [Macrococcus goetzii]TDM49645.1 noncanonical pyrimidine nucleotidase, YjjG family [Macrococcus goetzii]
MYKYILFDIDNTLLDFSKGEREAIRAVFQSEGVEDSEENFKRYSEINKAMWGLLEEGKLVKQEVLTKRFEGFFAEKGIKVNPQEKEDIFRIGINENHQLMAHSVEILEYVKSKGYVICSATNGVLHTQMRRMTDANIISYFDHQFISEAVGFEKPQKAFFDVIIESLNIKDLSEVLMIGDTETSDINGAIHAGIDACYFGPDKDSKAKYTIHDLLALKKML